MPPLSLQLYRGISGLVSPLVGPILKRRLQRGKEDGTRLHERLGYPTRSRPAGPLVWLHAASVGETISILPLLGQIAAHCPVMLTTGTVTSAQLAEQRLPANAFHQFIPVDVAGAVARFLDHWRPDLGIFCESELWPNLMMAAYARNIPLGIVNGRMSAKSFKSWNRLHKTAHALLSPLAFCLAQSAEDAVRYARVGATATSHGNLKFDVPPLPVDGAKRALLAQSIGDRPVFVAASTHPGEDEKILIAAKALRITHPDLLTILIPRHPERGVEIAALCDACGERAQRRATGGLPQALDAVYIADTLGELGLFYGLARLAFIGGSLVERGGHNPIEAIKFSTPILSGPHVMNFAGMFSQLESVDGVRITLNAEELAHEAHRLLSDPDHRQKQVTNAGNWIALHEGALARTMAVIAPFLPLHPLEPQPLAPHSASCTEEKH